MLAHCRQINGIAATQQVGLESHSGIRTGDAIGQTIVPQITGVIDLFGAVDQRSAHHGHLTGIGAHAGVGAHELDGHVELERNLQRIAGVDHKVYEAVFQRTHCGLAVHGQRVGAPRPAGDAQSETDRAVSGAGGQAIPREVRTLLDRQAGSEFGCVGDELVAQHGLAAVALGVDVAVHGGDESGDVGRAAGAAEPVDAVGEHVVAVRVIQSVRRGLQCIDVVVPARRRIRPWARGRASAGRTCS